MAGGGRVSLDRGAADTTMCAMRGTITCSTTTRAAASCLIGHSQGAYMLTALIRTGDRWQADSVAAGVGDSDGDDGRRAERARTWAARSRTIPLCRAAAQTGCVIIFAAFRSTVPPPANTLFGARHGSGHGSGLHESRGARRRKRRAACIPLNAKAGRSSARGHAAAVGDAGRRRSTRRLSACRGC